MVRGIFWETTDRAEALKTDYNSFFVREMNNYKNKSPHVKVLTSLCLGERWTTKSQDILLNGQETDLNLYNKLSFCLPVFLFIL